MKTVIIYADGACSGNPGPGGWAAIILDKEHKDRPPLCGSVPNTTNSIMELTGVIKRILAHTAKLFALALAALIAVSDISTINVYAANTNSVNTEMNTGKYDDVNTLGATVTVKNNILKVKKRNVAQMPKPSKVTVNGTTLKANKDYTLSYQVYKSEWKDVESLTKAGTYRMCITGIGEYSGVCTKRIYVYDAVESVPVSSLKITVNKMSYTGEAITSGVIKSVKYKNTTLTEGDDYTVTYLNNVDSGTGVVRITAVEGSGFTGEKDVKFTISGGTKICKAKITGVTARTYDYGNPVTQDMSQVKVTVAGNELTLGRDYAVLYYTNNKKVGTAKMVITGKGLYYGTITKTFKINKIKLTSDMLDEDSKAIVRNYTKKAVKPELALYNSNGDRLVKGTDYTLSYKNNMKISDKALITVKGKGNYTGSLKVYFTIKDKTNEPEIDETEESSESGEVIESETSEPESVEVPEVTEPESVEVPEVTEPESVEVPEVTEPEIPEIPETDESEETEANDNTDVEETHTNSSYREKPIGFVSGNCGHIMPYFFYGWEDDSREEDDAWHAHEVKERENGKTTGYTTCTYEQALKNHHVTEDMVFIPLTFYVIGEDGLLVPAED